MSDIYNNSGNPEYSPDSTNNNIPIDNPEQNYQSETGSTYWESNGQQSGYNSNEQTSGYGFNGQQQQQPVYSQQNIYQNTPYADPNNQFGFQPVKKSKKKPLVAALIVLVLLIGSAATAFAFSGTAKNKIALLTKSPKEYLAHVIKQTTDDSVDKMINYMKINNPSKDIAVDMSVNLTYDKATVGSLLYGATGSSIEDLEDELGMSLDSIGFDMIFANNDKKMYDTIGVKLNDVNLLTADIFIDYATQELLVQFPELSPAYLRQSLDMSEFGDAEAFDTAKYYEILDLLSSNKTGDFLKRYSSYITDEIKEVKLAKGKSLTVGDITVKTNVLTFKIRPETIVDILTRILEEAKKDNYIIKEILPMADVSKEEYVTSIDMALQYVKMMITEADDPNDYIDIKLFVGNDGSIIGTEIDIMTEDVPPTISYYNVEKKNKGAYELIIKDQVSSEGINVTGSHTIKNGAYTGAANFNVTMAFSDPVNFKIAYEDAKVAMKGDHMFTYGKFTLSSILMMGIEVFLEYDVKDNAQLSTLQVNMGSSSLVTLKASTKYLKDFKCPAPGSNADYYDFSEVESYLETIDVDKFTSTLYDKLGIDINNLMGDFLPDMY